MPSSISTTSDRCFVIAEAGVNHNGSLDLALQLIDIAADAGADAVKFQTFKAEAEISKHAAKAEYQLQQTDEAESQLEMVKKLELDLDAHRQLVARCEARGIEFMSTPFDLGSVDLLVQDLNVHRLKVASGEITHAPLLFRMAQSGKPIVLSTGMGTIGEIETALGILALGYLAPDAPASLAAAAEAFRSTEGQRVLHERVIILHCVTEYPAPFGDVNLRAMDSIRAAFGLPVGYSDHTLGLTMPIAATARGCAAIEKHFTLDRTMPGPDHAASLEPGELAEMVAAIRNVEASLGDGIKRPQASELKNIPIARKSLVAARAIAKGERFSTDNLICKRPGTGIPALDYWNWLGKPADRDYAEDELIDRHAD